MFGKNKKDKNVPKANEKKVEQTKNSFREGLKCNVDHKAAVENTKKNMKNSGNKKDPRERDRAAEKRNDGHER